MRPTSTERYILCGGYGPRKLDIKKKSIDLNLWGKDPSVTLKISDIDKRMAANVPSIFVDLLEIATYVYCADQAVTRGGDRDVSFGNRWRRHFRFFIPVRNPGIWSSHEVIEVLQDTLGFLSDDEYEFTFAKLSNPPAVEQYFEFGIGPGSGFSTDEVVLFSGGLDSLSGAVQETIINKRSVALVSHRSSPKIFSYQRDLVQELSRRCQAEVRPFHVPVWVYKDPTLSRDYNQRTRSFLYACLGAAVASMFKLSRIRFYENGIVSFNLPISAQVIGAKATRVTHPRVLSGFAKLFSLLTKAEFEAENPFMWKTKAEVVGLIGEAGCADLIKHTVSCNQVRARTTLHPHCGVCSQCIDRRFGTLAAGYGKDDAEEMYKINLLTGELELGPDRTMVESYVRTAKEVDKMSDEGFLSHFGEINKALLYLEDSIDIAATKVLDLHRRHAREVLDVLDTALKENVAEIRKGTLPSSCLLILALPDKYKTIYRAPGKENIFRKEGQKWTICYEGQVAYLDDIKGLHYISFLLKHRGREFHATELRSLITGGNGTLLLGSAGEAADSRAITQYKSRLADLETELEVAKDNNDLARQESISDEIELLEHEISRSVGLGGRPRKVSDDYERARKAVSAAITRSMAIIEKEHSPLWQHLKKTLHMGTPFNYTPERPISWKT